MPNTTADHTPDQAIQPDISDAPAPASPPSPMVYLSVFGSLYDTATERSGAFPWEAIAPKFTKGHLHTASKEAAPLYSFAHFRSGGTCCNADVSDLSVFVMDIDGGTSVEDIKSKLAGYEYVVYSTYNYTPQLPKIRVLMPMTRLITANEWPKLWLAVDQWLGGGVLDASTKNVGRRYWFPSCPEENRYWAFAVHNSGNLLDPDEFLSSQPPSFSSPPPLSQAAIHNLNTNITGGLPKPRPDMTQGYGNDYRTHELTRRAGWCLGPDKMSEAKAVEACLAWNQYNTPPLDEEKIISTVRSIAKSEAKKATQAGTVGQVSSGVVASEVAALPPDAAARIAELAWLSKFDYDRCRTKEAEALGVRVLTLDDLVAECRPKNPEEDSRSGKPLSLPSPEPWPEAVDGADLLDQIVAEILRYVVLPDGAAEAMALWTVHAHAFEASHITPRLVLLSPVMRCGKTTAMRIVGGLVPKKLMSANITPAATFRTIEKVRPTLLIDEADSFLKDNEEMRGIINCGHAFDGVVIRTVGDELEPRAFSAWCPLVLASIGRVTFNIHPDHVCRVCHR